MIEAGVVGAAFKIEDLASPVLRRIIGELEALQGVVDKTKASLATFALPPGLNRQLGTMSRALASIEGSATKAGNAMTANFAKADGSVDKTIGRVGALKSELAAAAREARAIRVNGIGAGGRAGAMGHGGSSGGSSGGHGGIHAGFHGTEPTVGGRSNDNAVIAGVVTAIGTANVFEKGADLRGAEERLRLGGISQAEIDKARRAATEIGGVYGFRADQMLDMLNEIRNPLGGVDHALEHLPTLAKAMFAIRGMDTKRGGDGKVADDAYSLVKSAEFRNAVSPEAFDRAIDSMVKATIGTGGKVTPREWLLFSKYSRASLPGMSDEYLYQIIPEMIQEFGGSGAGTAQASLFQQIISGQMRTTGFNLLDKLGEIDPTKVKRDKNGRIVSLEPKANIHASEAEKNWMLYAATVADDLVRLNVKDENEQREWASKIIGNRTASQFLNQLMTQGGRINRGAAGIRDAMGLDAASKELADNNPWTAWDRLKNSFSTSVQLTGDNAMNGMVPAMNGLTNLFKWYSGLLTTPANESLLPSGGASKWQAPEMIPVDWAVERGRRSRADYARDPEIMRAAGYATQNAFAGAVAAPNVKVDVKPPNVDVKVSVTLDGKAIGAAVGKTISITPGAAAFSNGSSGFDGRLSPAMPDVGGMH